jgi:uncharacterized protein YgbK (DUF1537 family)
MALVCPAFPENGRTVYQAHLFVYDQLLQNTHMATHPLTPMKESDIRKLLAPQTRCACGHIPLSVVREGTTSIAQCWENRKFAGINYIVADAVTSDDLHVLGEFAADHKLITGGSGIVRGLPENFRRKGKINLSVGAENLFSRASTPLLLSGSCSKATLEQIGCFSERYPAFRLNPLRLRERGHVEEALAFARKNFFAQTPCLIYASAPFEEVRRVQETLGNAEAGELIERSLAFVAKEMANEGVRRFVVAGGETSGAVVSSLGIKALRIGNSIAPGVPWVASFDGKPIVLALKSGNFGSTDFFLKACS